MVGQDNGGRALTAGPVPPSLRYCYDTVVLSQAVILCLVYHDHHCLLFLPHAICICVLRMLPSKLTAASTACCITLSVAPPMLPEVCQASHASLHESADCRLSVSIMSVQRFMCAQL